jgi:hypothetical protein
MNTTLHRLEKQKEIYELLKENVKVALAVSDESAS